MSLVSRVLRNHCEPYIFFSITLSDGKGRANRISKVILQRLSDPEDGLARGVRHVSVAYNAAVPEKLLLEALRNVRFLESFNWCTWLPVSPAILDCFHKLHPNTRLNVNVHDRRNLPLDALLLSSPQLHTLNVTLSIVYEQHTAIHNTVGRPYTDPDQGQVGQVRGKTETKELKNLLIQGGNIKVLRLRVEPIDCGSTAARNRFKRYGHPVHDPAMFHFEEQDVMPALEELSILHHCRTSRDVGVFREVCEAWRAHQDWSALRSLDLRFRGGDAMASTLSSGLPHLQRLKLGMLCDDTTIRNILMQTSQLAHLHIDGTPDSGFESQRFPALCAVIPFHLSSLYVRTCFDPRSWHYDHGPDSLRGLLERCPHLEALAMEGPSHQLYGAWTISETALGPYKKSSYLVTRTQHRSAPKTRAAKKSLEYEGYREAGFWHDDEVLEHPEWSVSVDREDGETREAFTARKMHSMFGLTIPSPSHVGRKRQRQRGGYSPHCA